MAFSWLVPAMTTISHVCHDTVKVAFSKCVSFSGREERDSFAVANSILARKRVVDSDTGVQNDRYPCEELQTQQL